MDFEAHRGLLPPAAVRWPYAVDWSAVTATYTGEVKGTPEGHTVGGAVRTFTKVYDIASELVQPASVRCHRAAP